jgi:predicted ATPase
MIKSINIESWRQFDKVQLNFHNRLTILTGANGAGKTTILNIINQHFGWQNQLVGTAKRDKKTGGLNYLTGFWKKLLENTISPNDNNPDKIGTLHYSNGQQANLLIPKKIGTVYNVQIERQLPLNGFNIPSHRPIYQYQAVPNISTSVITKKQAFNSYRQSQKQRYFSQRTDKTETYYIKETLISLAALGYGNQIVNPNEGAIKIYEGFIDILKTVLPPKLGFKSLSIRIPEVILETESGEFSIDAVSGGIASIIDLAWQIYMFDDSEKPFVVSFDEPENHLHPEMQKTLLPNFLQAFPNVQFIVASHNPFIISSVNDSNVYALVYNKENKVTSELLDNFEKSGTANEILRQVLGIETTTPEWVDDRLDQVLNKYSSTGITPENIQTFKNELTEIGLDKYINQAVVELISRKK